MSNPRYILAKYVPNLSRMEPRNIGIFLWHKGHLLSHFLDTNDAKFVKDKSNYIRWVTYWKELIEGEQIKVAGHDPRPKKHEDCLDALLKAQEGEYLLVDAGFVPSKMSVKDMPQAVTYLFNELVALQAMASSRIGHHTLKNRCNQIWNNTEITQRKDYQEKYPVECPVYGVNKRLHFHYGFGNGEPRALLQRVMLSKEQSVNSSAFMFHTLLQNAMLEKDHCAALIQGSDINGEMAEEGKNLLDRICQVIDVENEADAVDRIRHLVPSE